MNGRTFLYIIGTEGGVPFKVGIASDVDNRLAQIQTGNPSRLEVVWYVPFPSRRMALDAERSLHSALRNHSLRGEWFGCQLEIAGAAAVRVLHSVRDKLNIQTREELLTYFAQCREAA